MTPVSVVFHAMLAKDARREFRSREIFISSFLLSIILLTIIYFASTTSGIKYEKMVSGALWICLIFSGTLAINRAHQSEANNGCYRALMLYPVEGGWLYLSKVVANFALLFTMAALLLPLMALFFHADVWPHLGLLLLTLALGIAAFVSVGTLVVVITASTRIKDVLFPVIQLPLVVPVVLAGVNATESVLRNQAAGNWLQFLFVLNLVFLPLGFLLYDFLLEE